LPVPPPVSVPTLLNAIRLAAASGGGGGGSGTVTSVSVTTQNGVSATVTNPTTTPALAFTLGAITPTTVQLSGSVSGTTLLQSPAVAGSSVVTFPSVTGTLAIIGNPLSQFASTTSAQLAGVISDETGSGSLVFANTPTLVSPILGTPTSGNLSNCTGFPASGISGTLAAANGGTGVANGASCTLTLPNAATTITTGGTLALGGFTLTVPATGTAALLGTANVFTAAQTLPSGTNTATSLNFGTAGTGIYGTGSQISFAISGTLRHYIDFNGTWTTNGAGITVINANFTCGNVLNRQGSFYMGASDDLIIARKAARTLQLGLDAAGVLGQMLTAASRITSDGAGADLTIAGGNGRGGAGGSLILATYSTAGAATVGTLTTRLTLDTNGLLTFADAVDLAFNTTTGTKIGTATSQKIGFWNATPIVQPTTSIMAAPFTIGGGSAVFETSDWDGYNIGQIVAALRSVGILA